MNTNLVLDASINLVYILIELGLFGLLIYYVRKQKSLDGILLLTSSVLNILNRPLMYFGYKYLENNHSDINILQVFDNSLKIYGILSSIIFTIGLLLLVIKQTNKNQKI